MHFSPICNYMPCPSHQFYFMILIIFSVNKLWSSGGLMYNFTLSDLGFSQRWLWRMPSSRMWRRVDLVNRRFEERIASIFRVEKSGSEEPAWASGCSLLLADFSTLQKEAIRSSETSVHTRSTRRHIPEDGILQFYIGFHFVFRQPQDIFW
jgi:hypothetical protein